MPHSGPADFYLPARTYLALVQALARVIDDGRPDIEAVASEVLAHAGIWDEGVRSD